MKRKAIVTLPLLSSLLLSACGTNDNGADETAMRDTQTNEIARVHYTPGDDTGDFGSMANWNFNNRANDADQLDTNSNRHNGTLNNNVNRNVSNVNNNRNNDIANRNRSNENNNGNRFGTNVNNNRNNENRIEVADRAADKIAAMREVDTANVFVTENNAYVAAQLANNAGDELTADLEKKIADMVKSTDRDINNVYVSVNPDFYNRTTSYANDIRKGRPVAGFFEEFTTLVQRIFPTER